MAKPKKEASATRWSSQLGLDPYDIQAMSNSFQVPPPGVPLSTDYEALTAKYPDLARQGYQPGQLAVKEAWETYLGDTPPASRPQKMREAWTQIVAQNPSMAKVMPANLYVSPEQQVTELPQGGHDYYRTEAGGAEKESFLDRNPWIRPALIAASGGGAVALPAMIGSGGAAGAGAAGSAATAGGAGGAGAAGGVLPSTITASTAGGTIAGSVPSGAVAAGAGGAGVAGGTGSLLGQYALGGAKGIGDYFGARTNAAAQERINAANIEAARQRQQADIAARESELDPFRQQMMQGRDLSRLDMMQNTKPTQAYGISDPKTAAVVGATPYDRSQPRTPVYAPSADVLNWLAMIKQNVAGGQNQAPTMTNPSNYGKTSALDLLSLASGNPQDAAYARGVNQSPPTGAGSMRPLPTSRRNRELL